MNRLKRFSIGPGLRMGLPVLLGTLAAVVLLTLAPGLGERPPGVDALSVRPASGAALIPVTYTLDDFDDWVGDHRPRTPNDFYGRQGRWESGGAVITDTVECAGTFSCSLSLAYDLTAPGAEGGYWEEFVYSYTVPDWPLRDLSEFEQLMFRVRGSEVDGFPEQFQIEFIGQDWGARAAYPVTGVTTSWQWKTISLAGAGTLDWSRVKQIAIKLVGGDLADKTGRLFLDDMALIDQDSAEDLLDLVERRAFAYFWENRHPNTGFVRDRAVDPFYDRDVTSVAAVGFELAAFAIGAEHGWTSRGEAVAATHQVLDTLYSLPLGPATTGTAGYHGFFYHMLDIDTGERAPDAEVSTVDTALLMAGVLLARQYYTGADPTEASIRGLADQLYNRVEWDWALRDEPEPAGKTNQFHMAWKPEFHDCQASGYQNCYEIPDAKSGHGYFAGDIAETEPITRPTTWDYYTDEILLINLLAIGSPTHAVAPETFWAWERELGIYDGYTFYQSWFGQLFTHQIGQVWLDLRDAVERDTRINWWHNSRLAAQANRRFAIDQAITCSTYSALSWGLSTSLGYPDEPASPAMAGVGVYRGYGAPPAGDPAGPVHDCTIAPYAAASSILFLSANPAENEAYQAMDHWFHTQPRLWGIYGFRDGFNLDRGWFAHDYIGLDQGMTLLAVENYQTGFIWDTLGRDPALRSAISAVFEWNSYLPMLVKGSTPAP